MVSAVHFFDKQGKRLKPKERKEKDKKRSDRGETRKFSRSILPAETASVYLPRDWIPEHELSTLFNGKESVWRHHHKIKNQTNVGFNIYVMI